MNTKKIALEVTGRLSYMLLGAAILACVIFA